MESQIKIYRMPLARVFPAAHPKAGEQTGFKSKILKALTCPDRPDRAAAACEKLHTIRATSASPTAKTWLQKVAEVQKGEAVLALYEWSGKPYSADGCANLFVFGAGAAKDFISALLKSEKYRHAHPAIDSGVGVQELSFGAEHIAMPKVRTGLHEKKPIFSYALAKNDGLTVEDFRAWFKGYDLSRPLEIVHFTKFRYA